MTIQILSNDTINKIAAGEVIERPANVLKELIENSLDAKSTLIDIEIKDAGKQLIRVRDNGIGMSREDLTLAVTRHATSKISDFKDLESLSTLGFRGEALPSIASVSTTIIQSHQGNKKSGWEEKYVYGILKESRAYAGTPGTTVEVLDLFSNTPARKKFLKADATERHHMIRTIEEIALAHTGVAFTLISEGKTVFKLPMVKDPLERITDILGTVFAQSLIPVTLQHPNIELRAYATKTEHSLSNRNYQFLIVNGRSVTFTKTITHSLYEAYRERLPQGRHPGIIMYITIAPSEIDVNTHPTKREIRFSKEQEIHALIYRAIKNVLVTPMQVPISEKSALYAGDTKDTEHLPLKDHEPFPYAALRNNEAPSAQKPLPPDLRIMDTAASTHRILGQAFNLYVIAQDDEGVLIIDQHAAAERIRFEKYMNALKTSTIATQPLLIPLTLELPPSQIALIQEHTHLLSAMGWEISIFGRNTIRISAQPNILGIDTDMRGIIDKIIEAMGEERKQPEQVKVEKIIKAACKASIKANESISDIEMKQLIIDLMQCKAPYTCPHGRPTLIKLSKDELNRKFRRS